MIKAKHTSGNWSPLITVDDCDRAISFKIHTPRDCGWLTICDSSLSDIEDPDEIEANADLIAAAPDLFAVAQMVIDMATIETPPELLSAANFALRKAEGR